MIRLLVQIGLLSVVPVLGLAAMLLAKGEWRWAFLALIVLPLLCGLWRFWKAALEYFDEMSARSAEW